jgi:hypothetical protein
MTRKAAAEALSMSGRQLRRILDAFKTDDVVGLRHKSIGKPGHHKIPEGVKREALETAKERYPDAGPAFLSDLLKEGHGIEASRETLRRWLDEDGARKIQESKPRRRRRRERKASSGIMVQMDTSIHDWFRTGIKACLIALVDDATSTVYARFYETDSTMTNMDAIRRYITAYGIPASLYTDRASHFKVNAGEKPEDVLDAQDRRVTQIERASRECGISIIHAKSPQGKGRVERLFSVLQDRLEKRLHYAGIKDVKSANDFLDGDCLQKYNQKYRVNPVADFDSHRPVGQLDLEAIFSVQVLRVCANDFTVSLNGRKYQIARENDLHGLPRKNILMEKRLDGSVRARHAGRYLIIHETDRKSGRTGQGR